MYRANMSRGGGAFWQHSPDSLRLAVTQLHVAARAHLVRGVLEDLT